MAASYDNGSTDAGKVRLLISDVGGADGSNFIFNDDEIVAFLAMESHYYRAAAAALRTMAASEVMVQKRIKFLELSTDGPAEATALQALADRLDDRADYAEDDEGDLEVVNMGDSPFTTRDLITGSSYLDD